MLSCEDCTIRIAPRSKPENNRSLSLKRSIRL
jgi:hypothetical protein